MKHASLLPGGRAVFARAALALACSAFLLLGGTARAAVKETAKPPQVKLEFEKYTLPNGLEVVLHEDHQLPIVAVNIWYHAGPANERAGQTGFAHLFEHLMFQSSGHVPEDSYFKYLEAAGASFVNGSTDFDRTNYLEDLPSNQLELALWLESDRMGFLLDRLDAPSFANQQDVVRNERRQSVENAPYGLVEEELYHQLFPKTHPYYASVIGSHEDIQNAKLDDVREFFKRYYVPNNATLVIAGDLDKVKTKALVTKYFGSIPKGQAIPAIEATTPPITQERRSKVTDKIELPRVFMGWITSPIFKPGDAEAGLAADILGGGKASRLYKSLVYDKQIAQDVNASMQSLALGSVFEIVATAKPGHTAEELEAAIDAEIQSLAASGPTPTELAASQNSTYSGIVSSVERIGGFGGVADRINMYNQFTNDPGYLNKDLARYAAVTPDGVKKFTAEQLAKEHRVVVYGLPGEKVIPPAPPTPAAPPKSEAKVESKEPWRNTIPSAGPTTMVKLPMAKRFSLPNGLTVLLVESHRLPVVAGTLVLRSGSAQDPQTLPGLAGFTATMLDEGTQKRDALAIANELHGLGASLSTGSSVDGSTIACRSLKGTAAATMAILSDVAQHPSFPEKDIERVRDDRVTNLLQQRDSPNQTASRIMWNCLYGPTHPYGHISLGTSEALKKISRDDMVRFYQAYFTPQNAALVFVGDLTESEARKLATDALGSWTGPPTETPRPPQGTMISSRVVIVDKPGMPQTSLRVVQLGLMRSDPDFERMDLANTILGGLFSSRINMNLREEHGYTYGAFSLLSENRGQGPFLIGTSVRTDVTGASIDEILKEVHGMVEKPVTADELRMAKESTIRTLPANFQTTGATAGTIATLYLYDLPPDYYQTLPGRISAIQAADVQAVSKKYLAPDRMLVIAVGDRSKIEPQITKLNLGAVAYKDLDGKEVTAAATN
ncbi:MAG TPA: pitrilysin family protein [Candidatus Limnocylindrales bacterium]|nr:pitrilysin family protein [Candidatus Limnocylindrales bacterium]